MSKVPPSATSSVGLLVSAFEGAAEGTLVGSTEVSFIVLAVGSSEG